MTGKSQQRWLEVALNGPWTRRHQPRIPIAEAEIIDEAVACVQEGASIVHVHAYDPQTGRQKDDPDIYARIIEGVRSRVDAIVYPTVPFAAASNGPGASLADDRFNVIEVLGRRGLLEWSVVDLGSLNFVSEVELMSGENGFVHTNAVPEIRRNLQLAATHGFHPSYTVYEPGFLRMGALMHRAIQTLPRPVYRLMFSDIYTFGFRPNQQCADVYLALLEQCDPGMPWMVAGLGVDIAPLLPYALERGGHIRVGLEDLPPGATVSNVDCVRSAARLASGAGYALAGADEIRAALQGAG